MHQKEVQNSVFGEALTKIIYFEMMLGYVSTISSLFKGSIFLTINIKVLKKLPYPDLFLTVNIVAYFFMSTETIPIQYVSVETLS